MLVSGTEIFEKATELLVAEKDLDKAFDMFNKLLNECVHKKDHMDILLFHVGSTAMKLGWTGLAFILFKMSLEYRSNFIESFNNLGYLYKKELMEKEATHYFEKAIDLAIKNPKNVPAWFTAEIYANLGSMYIANGTPQKAMGYFDKAIKTDENLGLAKWNRSLAYLELGNYEEGFRDYEFGERTSRSKDRNYGIDNLPFWDGTKGQTVVVYGEQGIGDEIMFASMIPDLMKDCNVILDVHPRLMDLFRLAFPTIPIYGTRKSEKVSWPQFHKVDAKIGMGSLGKFYRKKVEDFPRIPYMTADIKLVDKYFSKLKALSNRPKIGISWRGGTKETNRNSRYIPLDMWLDILKIDADFISLQYDKDIGPEIEDFNNKNNVKIHHWQDTLDDYDETAGLVANLDLIISVPQSVVHLAGAMGVPTVQLVPFKRLWQAGPYQQDMPWYNTVKNIWQDEKCDWKPVLNQVKENLCSLLAKSIES
jgi:tetratricopeptide (TPR) repeat protein